MGLISEYLVKFQNVGLGAQKCRQAIEESLVEILGAERGDFEAEDRGGGRFVIKCSPALKNEIAIRKTEILSAVKKKTDSSVFLR